jgi:hypothetical protein
MLRGKSSLVRGAVFLRCLGECSSSFFIIDCTVRFKKNPMRTKAIISPEKFCSELFSSSSRKERLHDGELSSALSKALEIRWECVSIYMLTICNI